LGRATEAAKRSTWGGWGRGWTLRTRPNQFVENNPIEGQRSIFVVPGVKRGRKREDDGDPGNSGGEGRSPVILGSIEPGTGVFTCHKERAKKRLTINGIKAEESRGGIGPV